MRLLLAALVPLLMTACGTPAHSSEREWRRAQCGQINDTEAREKCLKQVDYEFGSR